MQILLDNCSPKRLRRHLLGHEVVHVAEIGFATMTNGDLLTAAEQAGYDVIVTTDKNMRFQQSLAGRRISIVTFAPLIASYPNVADPVPRLLEVLVDLRQGVFVTIEPR